MLHGVHSVTLPHQRFSMLDSTRFTFFFEFFFTSVCVPSPAYDPSSSSSSKTEDLHRQINDVVLLMQQNIDSVQGRGEQLDNVRQKSSYLEQNAIEFKRSANNIRRKMWWKNIKWTLLIGLLLVILLVIIIVSLTKNKSP
ncbi:MAG: synaptobrevin-domain-containing protein [Benniella sp.]|nr:MAG: synaptobrevin-domain-containing protein [Benniella sp.]